MLALCAVELRKLRHDRTELYTRAAQPARWLLVFGRTFARIRAIPTGGIPYIDYLAPGVIAQSAMFVAIFYGMLKLLGVAAVVVLASVFFSCLPVTIAGIVLSRDRMTGFGQAITMPVPTPCTPSR